MSSLHIENQNTLFFHNFFFKKIEFDEFDYENSSICQDMTFSRFFFILMNFSSLESA